MQVYEGVATLKGPADLAAQDIVIMSLSHFKHENGHFRLPNPHRRHRRHDREFKPRPVSPLKRIHFWRVVLDESQDAGSAQASVFTTVGNITAVHRLCMSGTPLPRQAKYPCNCAVDLVRCSLLRGRWHHIPAVPLQRCCCQTSHLRECVFPFHTGKPRL